ncbi:MAG TPA: glycosyltransferase [Planctomycetaceae bacterium]|jgi:spore maturation protein CgeB|nr:glycosyltransferase [Planctomycetaceae bacterium]
MTRFLIVNADYPDFLEQLYSKPGLAQASYQEQMHARVASLFGVSDFYPRNLAELGHTALEVYVNNHCLQEAWAREHGVKTSSWSLPRVVMRRGLVPWLVRDRSEWMAAILRAQIEEFRPDVVLTHSLTDLPTKFWTSMRSHYRLLVGQIASPLANDIDLRPFDLMLSSLPNFVERFRAAGLRAEPFRLAFDPIVLERLNESSINPVGPPINVSFVGSLSPHHAGRFHWLGLLYEMASVEVWGQGINLVAADSPIRKSYHGEAWGLDMYRILSRSRISVNYHIELSGEYANNMRLYETTGVGALLLTDWKRNLHELFEPDVEVVAYRTPEECVERIRYLLDHEEERARIAKAGQARTLRDHSYRSRMAELVALTEGLLPG